MSRLVAAVTVAALLLGCKPPAVAPPPMAGGTCRITKYDQGHIAAEDCAWRGAQWQCEIVTVNADGVPDYDHFTCDLASYLLPEATGSGR